MKLTGIITALITPFKKGQVDYPSLGRLIDQQLEGGVQGFVVNGTTAESPTLMETEVEKIFQTVKAKTPKNFPIILGTGSNSTAQTVTNTRKAKSLGADAALVVVPYYNKPPQRGLVQHFTEVAKSTELPIILYNVPGRTITAMTLETVQQLSRVPNIVGIKEASGNLDFAKELMSACGPEFIHLSGDDETFEKFFRLGGHGTISVASHIIPKPMVKHETEKHLGLVKALFLEANPIPVKYALHLMGVIESPELRSPLVEMDPALVPQLRAQLIQSGVLHE